MAATIRMTLPVGQWTLVAQGCSSCAVQRLTTTPVLVAVATSAPDNADADSGMALVDGVPMLQMSLNALTDKVYARPAAGSADAARISVIK